MHDPSVVAWDVVLPIPRRLKWRDRWGGDERRWALRVQRRTNDENRGERVYRWWRPKGYTLVLAGRAFGLYQVATIWHEEPGGRDAFTVCKHSSHWKWHVHHWRPQIIPLQRMRRFVFDRCGVCGRRFPYGYSPVSHSWDPMRPKHWWMSRRDADHHECSAMNSWKSSSGLADEAIQVAVAAYRLLADVDELTAIERLAQAVEDVPGDHKRFRVGHRMRTACGWEYDSDGDGYVRTADVQARREAERAERVAARASDG